MLNSVKLILNKKVILLSIFMSASSAIAIGKPYLTTFNQLAGALTAGKQVRMISSFSYCHPKNKAHDSKRLFMIGGANIDPFIYLTHAQRIITSNAPLVQMPNGQYGYNYVRYVIDATGRVEIFASMIDEKTHGAKVIADYVCRYDQGRKSGIRFRVIG